MEDLIYYYLADSEDIKQPLLSTTSSFAVLTITIFTACVYWLGIPLWVFCCTTQLEIYLCALVAPQ